MLQVCVVGKIVSVHDRNNSVVVVLSDGTGELEVNHWLPEESEHVRLTNTFGSAASVAVWSRRGWALQATGGRQ
jgi:hypothetical protein